MSRSGHRARITLPVTFLLPLLAAILTTVCAMSGSAGASPAPATGSAEIVFSNGGRILRMNADGSGREVIFGRDRNPVNDEFGAVEPAVSADGRKIVFGFRREAAYDSLTDIWVMDSDGSAARRLLRSNRNDQFGDPAFTAKGRIIVAQFRHHGRRGEARVFTMDLDGKQRKTMLRLPQRMRPWVGWRSFAEPSLSTDGRRLLYLLDPGYEGTFFGGRLQVGAAGPGAFNEKGQEAFRLLAGRRFFTGWEENRLQRSGPGRCR